MASDLEENRQPMLTNSEKPPKTRMQRIVRKFFKSTANLSNYLPTGTLLAFQIVAPTLTHDGKCTSSLDRILTISFISVLAFVCFILCFTDSVRDARGKVRYGIATTRGFWIIDGSKVKLPSEVEASKRIKALDFLHAFLTILVLGTMVFFNAAVDYCFFPQQTLVVKGILLVVPIAVGVVCSCLFLLWPSRRHGVGFPLSKG